MLKMIRVLPALMMIAAAGLVVPNPAEARCARIDPTRPGEIYFMRGLANIFSVGLDAFAKEMSDKGIGNCVFNHSHWQSLVNDIVERGYRGTLSPPIVIIGHSLGANIAPRMATTIGKAGVPVAYVVMLDPVEPTVVGANVDEIFNYYLPKRRDNRLYPAEGFDGLLENVNVKLIGGFDHFNIDENRQLRAVMKDRIVALSDIAAAPSEDAADGATAPAAD